MKKYCILPLLFQWLLSEIWSPENNWETLALHFGVSPANCLPNPAASKGILPHVWLHLSRLAGDRASFTLQPRLFISIDGCVNIHGAPQIFSCILKALPRLVLPLSG